MTPSVRELGRRIELFIDGISVDSSAEPSIEVLNPSTGRRLSSIPVGCADDVDRAVRSCRRSFEAGHWSGAAPSFRKETLHRLADLIERDAAALDALDAAEMGKPISVARANAKAAAGLVRFYAEAVDKVVGDVYTSDEHSIVMQRRVPRGVVAAITPWNFPAFNAVLKAAPALAGGNSVLQKPSELSSRSAIHLAHLAVDAGLPPGVWNVVLGAGETVGRQLALHMDVDMLTFTGSSDVGKLLLQYAGQSNLKVVMAECGGKSPQIVFDDGVDLDCAADAIARLLLTNQGQICSVGSRLLVQRSIEAELVQKIIARFRNVVMGDALDPRTTFGPLASAVQCARVMRYIEIAQSEGAHVVAGGRRALPDSGGFFVEPTLFRGVLPTARIAQEEVFGPVISVTPFDSEAEAIRIANGTPFALAAYVWTNRMTTGMRVARAIRSAVWVNAAAPIGEGAGRAASHEPAGLSGIGTEGGVAGLESYLRRQLISLNHG